MVAAERAVLQRECLVEQGVHPFCIDMLGGIDAHITDGVLPIADVFQHVQNFFDGLCALAEKGAKPRKNRGLFCPFTVLLHIYVIICGVTLFIFLLDGARNRKKRGSPSGDPKGEAIL
jgi:hypothetical protein